jgi:hypothetical protein
LSGMVCGSVMNCIILVVTPSRPPGSIPLDAPAFPPWRELSRECRALRLTWCLEIYATRRGRVQHVLA